MVVLRLYQSPALNAGAYQTTLSKISAVLQDVSSVNLNTEACYYIETTADFTEEELSRLKWILTNCFEENQIQEQSFLSLEQSSSSYLFEIGPRLNFSTAWSTNAISICGSSGLKQISRIERSRRYAVSCHNSKGEAVEINRADKAAIVGGLHDRMTECLYAEPLESFEIKLKCEPVYPVDVLGQGKAALEKANKDLGLAFDNWDLDYYTNLFAEKIKRNPTSVECFDLAQSNSEHSRHWFFKGRLIVDGKEKDLSLFKMVVKTQENSNDNNVIKFSDNSSAIKGFSCDFLSPLNPEGSASSFKIENSMKHIIFTAETHNFPTGVAPFSGATTGTGGRIRDVQAAGKGAHVVAGTAGYCFGNLNIPGYELPWEDKSFTYPSNFAPPVEVAVEASNGASDYGNKFGEPVLTGFARSFGMMVSETERREWIKPIMFSGGLGTMEVIHVTKDEPAKGMKVVKLGGPVYRIGVGGGAASSIQVQGDNTAELDFGAVQRGDAEMEQKMNRVIRNCVERFDKNPILSIHDQGAGGNGNVLKEICEPAGAVIRANEFQLGDPTITTLELWGAEYQESNAILIKSEDVDLLKRMCARERCPVSFVGDITGDGRIRLEVEENQSNEDSDTIQDKKRRRVCSYPVDLELEWVLGKMPRKNFHLDHIHPPQRAFHLPDNLAIKDALDRVLRLPSVASKRYLTNKVDRSVTGLVAQQQCVGPLHTPLADVAVTAFSHFSLVGAATAIGEQPIKGLIDPKAGARMSVAESLTNLVFASVTDLRDVKCSGNWMWPAKLPGEGAALYDACDAMCEVMGQLGIAVDGGKDSLSMAARVGNQTIKAPGALVISSYVGCKNITHTVTPDFKCPSGKGVILYVDLSGGKRRPGGTALAQCFKQLGQHVPDLNDPALFVSAFNIIQELLPKRYLTAGHDISDGGLITCLLEMAFAGNCGIEVDFKNSSQVPAVDFLFSEELGWILEVEESKSEEVVQMFAAKEVPCLKIGHSAYSTHTVKISINGDVVVEDEMVVLRDVWEETSFQLEMLQANPKCVKEEAASMSKRRAPPFKVVEAARTTEELTLLKSPGAKPKVAVLREEGSNGDREMAASFMMADFEVWDVNMQDLLDGNITMDQFRGVAFVGGFSYADVCGSAKGWAASILFNPTVRAQFDAFKARCDSFSLGVCNGCQLMGHLGWVAPNSSAGDGEPKQGVSLANNLSERYESRFVTVRVEATPSIMLKDMEGSILGVWVAHGEGRFKFASADIESEVQGNNLVPIHFVDNNGHPTMEYPLNPNGSPHGIAGLCSQDGRHLAVMPHPERTTKTWQWPWMPWEWKQKDMVSPWLRMFENAYFWCMENQ